MSVNDIIIIGAGGHASVLLDLILQTNQYRVIGFVDSKLARDTRVADYPVLGDDAILKELFTRGITHACIGVGSVRDNSRRKTLFEMVASVGFTLPVLRHPRSIIAANVFLDEGAQVMAGAIIQSGSRIGKNTIINTGAQVDHDCQIGAHVHVAPGVVMSGGCSVGDSAFIGVGSTIIQGITIGANALVAAGAVVIHGVPKNTVVKGVPAV